MVAGQHAGVGIQIGERHTGGKFHRKLALAMARQGNRHCHTLPGALAGLRFIIFFCFLLIFRHRFGSDGLILLRFSIIGELLLAFVLVQLRPGVARQGEAEAVQQGIAVQRGHIEIGIVHRHQQTPAVCRPLPQAIHLAVPQAAAGIQQHQRVIGTYGSVAKAQAFESGEAANQLHRLTALFQ